MGSFLEDCGSNVPVVIEVDGVGDVEPRREIHRRPAILIGRGTGSTIRLDHPDVGRRHAYLQLIGGRLFCVDLDSRTGTHSDRWAGGAGWIDPGQAIRIGPYRVRALTGDADRGSHEANDPNPLSEEIGGAACPRAALEIGRRSGKVARARLCRTLTLIGRSSRCKIRLGSPEDSRFAAALLRTPGGFRAIDLRPSSRLAVNGGPLDGARLEEGDELEIGPYVASFRCDLPDGDRVPGRLKVIGPDGVFPVSPKSSRGNSGGDLLPVVHQFARMQQETNDHFDRVIVMVSQLFSTMHREAIDLVREELKEIRQLAAGQPPRAEPADSDGAHASPHENPARSRDPAEIHAIVSEKLAAFEREGRGSWNAISQVLNTLVKSR